MVRSSVFRALRISAALLFLLSAISFLHPRQDSVSSHSTEESWNNKLYEIPAARPAFPRQASFTNTTTTPITATPTSDFLTSTTSSGAALPTIPFGVFVTTIDGSTYTLTYVSTTASASTTIVETDVSTTSTTTVVAGGAVWAVPTLPPGYPTDSPPGPPPEAPTPDESSDGTDPLCIFGCGGDDSSSEGSSSLPCVIDCDGDGNDPSQTSGSPSQTQSQSDSQSSTQSSLASSTSSAESLTSSFDSSSSASTTTTSSSSSSSSSFVCEYGCDLCMAKRGAPAIPTPTAIRNGIIYYGESSQVKNKGSDSKREVQGIHLLEFESAKTHASKRDIPSPQEEDGIANTYEAVVGLDTTVTVEHTGSAFTGGTPSSQVIQFDNSEHNLFVAGLVGCTSVVIVSRKGAYMSHLWEKPAFLNRGTSDVFQTDVIQYLQDTLGAQAQSMFSDASTTKIYIMTPAPESTTIEEGDSSDATVGTSLTPDTQFTDRISQIETKLDQLIPNVSPTYFYYARQKNQNKIDSGAYGKAMVLYSNNQEADPSDIYEDLPERQSVWQVYMQAKLMGQDLWAANTGAASTTVSTASVSGTSISSTISSALSTVGSTTLATTTEVSSATEKSSTTTALDLSSTSATIVSSESRIGSTASVASTTQTTLSTVTASSTSSAPSVSYTPIGEGEAYCTSDSGCAEYGPCIGGGDILCISNACNCPVT